MPDFGSLLLGMVQEAQRQRGQGSQLQQALMQAQMKQQAQQQDPYRQMQMQLMQQFLGQGGGPPQAGFPQQMQGRLPQQVSQVPITPTTAGDVTRRTLGGRQPIRQPIQPTTQQPTSQFITQPSLSLGPTGPTVGFTRVADPEIAQRQQKLNIASGLRKEFNASKVYKDFQTVQRSEGAMKQALKMSLDPNIKSKIASDQALGVLFQKMLDPDSVVRESEYARTPEGAALVNRMRAFLPKLQKGGLALADEDRQALYDIAERLLNEAKNTMNQHIDRYTQISQSYGVEPKLILGNIKRFDMQQRQTQQQLGFPQQPTTQPTNQLNAIKSKWGLE